MSEPKYVVSSTPHIRSSITVNGIMKDVVIALCPAALAGIYYFGMNAAMIIAVSIISCMAFEALYQKLTGQEISIRDLSAVVTGLLLAMNLPSSSPLWLPVIGSFFAVVIVKQLFGGLGQNFFNPALAARAFLLISYPSSMIVWPEPIRNFLNLGTVISSATGDAVSSATPLASLQSGVAPAAADYVNALIGFTKGCIGETCAIALILGGIYLLVKQIIHWRIPFTYLATVFVMTFIFGRFGIMNGVPVFELLSGGLLLGAIFMATDYTTSPVTPNGQIIMGIGCGVITSLIRVYGGYPEGVSFAILLMNIVSPLLDRFTKPRVFGTKIKNPVVIKKPAKKEAKPNENV